jgi:hypothetical protein
MLRLVNKVASIPWIGAIKHKEGVPKETEGSLRTSND